MAFDWSRAPGLPDWLPSATIYLTRHGSRAYGTHTPESDEDFKGVCVPPRRYFLGFAHRFEQAETNNNDFAVFDLRKFFQLAAESNPSIIEVMWTDDADHVLVTPAGARLLAERELFLSRRVRQTFGRYALSQLKRIKTHRRWLLHPPEAPPTRAEFGLPDRPTLTPDQMGAIESQVRKQLEAWSVDLEPLDPATRLVVQERLEQALTAIGVAAEADRFRLAARTIGIDDNLLGLVERERAYRARAAEWEQYRTWLARRNPARAAIEARHGYDTKHAMHLVRLLRMCREILETGRVRVKRPDREELLSIRNGAWSCDELIDWAARQEIEVERAFASSPLPAAPDRERLDALCASLAAAVLDAS